VSTLLAVALGGRASAFYLEKDAGVAGTNIHVIEKDAIHGGATVCNQTGKAISSIRLWRNLPVLKPWKNCISTSRYSTKMLVQYTHCPLAKTIQNLG